MLNCYQMSITAATFECPVHFIAEKRTELYEKYRLGVSQVKNVLGFKKVFQAQTCYELGRPGVQA